MNWLTRLLTPSPTPSVVCEATSSSLPGKEARSVSDVSNAATSLEDLSEEELTSALTSLAEEIKADQEAHAMILLELERRTMKRLSERKVLPFRPRVSPDNHLGGVEGGG